MFRDILAFAISIWSVRQEYLTGDIALPTYQIISHESHEEAAQTCMCSITAFLKSEPSRGKVAPLQSFPMLSYVLSFGFNHLALGSPRSTVILEALQSLGADIRHYPSHWDRLCELREEVLGACYPPWPTSRHDFVPYILIAYSSPRLLELLLFSSRPLKPRPGTNPLVYAADLGKIEHAMALLASGVDINQQGLVVDDSHHASPLEVAIDLGEDVLVGELLQRGCLVTWKLLSTAVCMPWCSTRVLVRLMQTDEFVEWACEIGDEMLYRGVFNSARPNSGDTRKSDEDHVALVRRLRQMGQDLSADSHFGTELIERAVHAAHTSTLEHLLPPDQPPPPRVLLAAVTGDTSETVSLVHFILQKGVDVHAITKGGGDSALHLAARCPWELRSLELIQMLLEAGCSPHARNMRGETPWTIAATREYSSVVELLLSCSVPLPSYSLHVALEQHLDPQIIRSLMLRGANVHAVSEFTGNTVLHGVVGREVDEDAEDEQQEYEESDCLDLVQRFIDAGCNLSIPNSDGETALEAAIRRGYTSVIELLLSCNLNAPLPSNILHLALERGLSPPVIQSLILRGANVHAVSQATGNTVLHYAVIGREMDGNEEGDTRYEEYRESECLDLVRRFIDTGCDPSLCNSAGETALEVAMECEYTSVVELLLSCNLPLPRDILLIALRQHATLEIAQLLTRKGADVHFITSKGNTILHLAIAEHSESKRLRLLEIFIEAGCNPATCDLEGKTILEIAIQHEYISVVELLRLYNTPLPPDVLPIALHRCCSAQMVHSLVCSGANVHFITSSGDSVLHLAIAGYSEQMCWDLVKTFIDAGCNSSTCNSEGKTVMGAAIEREYSWVVVLLHSYNTPLPPDILLIALRRRSSPQMVHSLVRKGADVLSTTSNGDSVLHLAISGYSEQVCLDLVKTFINAGCNPSTCNSGGKTVLEIAIECGYSSMVVGLLHSYNTPLPPDILPIALHRRSSPQVVHSLVRKGANVLSTTSNGDSVLHLAAAGYSEHMCLDLVKTFIDAGRNPSTSNSGGKTVLEVAIERGYSSVVVGVLHSYDAPLPPDILPIALHRRSSPQAVHPLVRNGADVLSTTSNGDSVLHLTISGYFEQECCDLVKTFIDAGCNPSACRCHSEGKTVLEVAIECGYTSVVKLLLLHNVPFPVDILLIALRRRSTLPMVRFLIQNGADVHSTTLNGETVLHLAITEYREETSLYLVKTFIKARCKPAACNSDGTTVLEVAIGRGYTRVVGLLLSCNVAWPLNILQIALRRHSPPHMVRFLILKGADVRLTTSNGDTVLHLAITEYAGRMRQDLVNIFIRAGCSPTACNYEGKTVLGAAIERGCTSVVELLLSQNVPFPVDILSIALRRHSTLEMVQFLICKGADVHSTTLNGDTMLHLAVAEHIEGTCWDLVKTFIEAGCNPATCNSEGKTALEAAIQRDYMSVVELLLWAISRILPTSYQMLYSDTQVPG